MSSYFPNDVLAENFSHWQAGYSTFRRLNLECSKTKLVWDGWDALIEQGYSVSITKFAIEWYKNGLIHSPGDHLPSVEYIDGSKVWYIKGKPIDGTHFAELSNGDRIFIMDGKFKLQKAINPSPFYFEPDLDGYFSWEEYRLVFNPLSASFIRGLSSFEYKV